MRPVLRERLRPMTLCAAPGGTPDDVPDIADAAASKLEEPLLPCAEPMSAAAWTSQELPEERRELSIEAREQIEGTAVETPSRSGEESRRPVFPGSVAALGPKSVPHRAAALVPL
mmetsp:Transcript_119404/g.266709  ORF Transcript_119404/g.266709 Transcript_119404/m.266709 type:complete len:115 (+) Transcript_119404:327-671(+)